jgi:hypothetical protein
MLNNAAGEATMLKATLVIVTMLLLSGCCRVFGICTSVAVHSAITSPNQIAANTDLKTRTQSDDPARAALLTESCEGQPGQSA